MSLKKWEDSVKRAWQQPLKTKGTHRSVSVYSDWQKITGTHRSVSVYSDWQKITGTYVCVYIQTGRKLTVTHTSVSVYLDWSGRRMEAVSLDRLLAFSPAF